MWSLTSPTTCYSGGRRSLVIRQAEGKEGDGASVSLATALHEIHLCGLDSASDQEPTLKWEHVDANPNAGVDRICVGYAANSEYTVTALLSGLDGFLREANDGPATAALDEATAHMLRQSMYASDTADTASVTTATANSILSEPTVPSVHARRTSSSDLDMFSTSGDNMTALMTTDASQLHHQSTEQLQQHHAARLPTTLRGLLVWKDTTDVTTVRATQEIDFRPLAMTLGNVRTISTTEDGKEGIIDRPVVWMGSADAARLYAFYWVEEMSNLVPLPLEDDVFDFTSPIMAIDVREASTTITAATTATTTTTAELPSQQKSMYLAVACQDGTLRCIQFSHYDTSTQRWCAKEISQVIVDGPLVCLQLVPGTTHALVGSLCGYVMLQDEHGSPSLVADALEVDDEETEDSVLAVHGWGDWVAIGTQAGAVLLYRRSPEGPSYTRVGKWCFPYSIHEICYLGDNNGILVTTRKSLHWLTLHEIPPPNAGLAKQRIQSLLERLSAHHSEKSTTEFAVLGGTQQDGDESTPTVLHDEQSTPRIG